MKLHEVRMLKILVIESEIDRFDLLKMNLNFNGFETKCAKDATSALNLIKNETFDFILANHSLIEKNLQIDSFEIPIFFYDSKEKEKSTEPSDQNNVLFKKISLGMQSFKLGPMFIDPQKRVITLMGQTLSLGKKEFKILALLAKKSGNIVTRENILDLICDKSELFDRTVDSHIGHLRKKIRKVAGDSLKISSVYGFGYRLDLKNDNDKINKS